jgi:hypothetical protein
VASIHTSAGPAASEAPDQPDATGHTHEAGCLNCGTALVGDHCHACGQRAHVHRTLGAFFHDLLHGVFHFEGKTWRTLPMLAWRPGELTRRYAAGERAKFVSPIALFLFSVFLMFAVFNSVGGPFQISTMPQEQVEAIQRIAVEGRVLRDQAEVLERERARLTAAGQPTPAVDAQLAEVARSRQALEARRRAAGLPPPDSVPGNQTPRQGKVETGSPWLDHAIEKWTKNPSLMLYKLQSNAYKFSWVLIPLSVPFLALLFLGRRRRERLYDHIVFITYSIAFVTLLLIVLSFLRQAAVSEDGVLLTLALIVPVHMFRQLKGAYQLGWIGALWRTIALALFSLTVFALFLLLLFALGAM